MADSTGVHRAAARGFGQNASDYERARPAYPPDAVTFLVDRLGLGSGRTIVDVGAGTGKLTRLLIPSGAKVVAVEPVDAMRTELLRVLPEAVVHDATAEDLPFVPSSIDAIVCAQAFHWFASTAVLHEFARVLKRGGHLALVWNVRDNSVPWVQTFTDLLKPYEGDRPDHNLGNWREAFNTDVPFGPLETASFFHQQSMTPNLLVARAASMSFVGALDEQTRATVLERVLQLGSQQGHAFTLPYRTDVHVALRR
jgi:SAM-dependent methyltransferase